MEIDIEEGPAFAIARVRLAQGESAKGEAGAMLAMTPDIQIETSTQGGIMKGLKRSVLGGESFFMNTFKAAGPNAEVIFAPALAGDIVRWQLDGRAVFLQSGSYLASSMGIDIDSKWGGAKTFFSREGLFMLRCTGSGDMLVSSFGAIRAVDLVPGQTYIVDTGHMVGWDEGVGYEVQKLGNWKSTFLGGEGLVVKVTGPGRVYIQTRSPESFVAWLTPKLPTQRS